MTNSIRPHLEPVEQRDDQILVDRLYTIDEASAFLGYGSGSWLRKRIKEGTVPYVDLNPNGQRPDIRIRASHLNHIIDTYTYWPSLPKRAA